MSPAKDRMRLGVASVVAAALLAAPTVTLAGAIPADLRVSVDAPPGARVGETIAYEVAVANDGPGAALDALVEVPIPDAFVLRGFSVRLGSCVEVPGTLSCGLAPLAPGAEAMVAIEAGVVAGGEVATSPTVAGGSDPDPGNDTVEHVIEVAGEDCTPPLGTENDDHLVGTPEADVLCGFGGDDILEGLGGDDRLVGGDGTDTADFSSATGTMRVDLGAGTATGQGTDVLEGVENVVGGAGANLLRGDAGPNVLTGGSGVDILWGSGGADTLVGGEGRDFLHGGRGGDTLDGGPDADVCVTGPDGGSRTACEGPSLRDSDDTRGPMDLRRVRGPASAARTLVWRVKTKPWRTRAIRDEGFVLLWIDARGGGAWDHLVVARSNGTRLLGEVYRLRAKREKKIATVRVRHPNRRTVLLDLALRKVRIGPARIHFGWAVQTTFNGRGCARVCFDHVPRPALDRLSHPLP